MPISSSQIPFDALTSQERHDRAYLKGQASDMDTFAQLGGDLRSRRRDLGLSQDEVADLAGVSVRFVRDLEHGKLTVRTDKLLDVLDVLGLDFRVVRRGDAA